MDEIKTTHEMNSDELISAIEAILFAAGEPITAARVAQVLGEDTETIHRCAKELQTAYEESGSGIRLVRMNDSLQLCSAPEFSTYVLRALEHRKPPKLSPSALEALAVVAYFQPVTRAYIDQVRGVDSSYTVSSLLERGLIEACGRLEAPGRPTLYQTSKLFLRTMGITGLDQLPVLPDLASSEGAEKLQAAIEELQNRGQQTEIPEMENNEAEPAEPAEE